MKSSPHAMYRINGTQHDSILPFLKWPGGKRWIAPDLVQIIQSSLTGIYYEPFLGGGAVFFRLRPRRAVLSDINDEVVNAYLVVQSRPSALTRQIQQMPVSAHSYYRIRASKPLGSLRRAARFLYLNRTGFSGMYRLNRSGEFNVPYGGGERTPATLWENRLLEKAQQALRGVRIKRSDFETMLSKAKTGDVVYCDPTYTVAHDSNCFVRYNEKNFSWFDQERLARAATKAAARGALVIVSNAHHRTVRALYEKVASFRTFERKSLVSTGSVNRRTVREYLMVLKS